MLLMFVVESTYIQYWYFAATGRLNHRVWALLELNGLYHSPPAWWNNPSLVYLTVIPLLAAVVLEYNIFVSNLLTETSI